MRLGFLNKETGKNLLLALAGIVFAFLAIEFYLRIFDNPFDFRIRGNKIALPIHRQYNIHNTQIAGLDEYIFHKKNSLGFRGAEPPSKFQDYLTIVTIGGSTTESFYLSEGDTWTDQLGAKLETNFDRLWINNAGLDGTSTFGHILLMEDYIVQLKPKVVLFLVGSNDVGREDLNRYDNIILKPAPKLTDSLRDVMLNSSETIVLAYNLLWYLQTRNRQIGHERISFEELPLVDISTRQAAQIKQQHQQYLPFYRARLERLIEIARANNIEPVFITQPAVYGAGTDKTTGIDLTRIKVGNGNGELNWEILEMYNAAVKEVGTTHQVLVIDLANRLDKNTEFYYDMIHYTKAGSIKIAEILYKQLCPFLAEKYSQYIIKSCINP